MGRSSGGDGRSLGARQIAQQRDATCELPVRPECGGSRGRAVRRGGRQIVQQRLRNVRMEVRCVVEAAGRMGRTLTLVASRLDLSREGRER